MRFLNNFIAQLDETYIKGLAANRCHSVISINVDDVHID